MVSGGTVRVKGAENEMSGQGCLYTRNWRFQIAHFTDHDHIGSARRNARMAAAKFKTDLGLHLHLAKAILGLFLRDLTAVQILAGPVC